MHVMTSWNEVLAPSNIAPKWFHIAKEKMQHKNRQILIIIFLSSSLETWGFIYKDCKYIYIYFVLETANKRGLPHQYIQRDFIWSQKEGLVSTGITHYFAQYRHCILFTQWGTFFVLFFSLCFMAQPRVTCKFWKGTCKCIIGMQNNYMCTAFDKPIYKKWIAPIMDEACFRYFPAPKDLHEMRTWLSLQYHI